MRAHLRATAVKLFWSYGFELVKTTEIASAAGVTERTLFRHFYDKPEILFDYEEDRALALQLAAFVRQAPRGARSWATLQEAFRANPNPFLDRPLFEECRALIESSPALQERDALRLELLIKELSSALKERGHPRRQALLIAKLGSVAFELAVELWREDPSKELDSCVLRAFEEVTAVVADPEIVSPVTGDTILD